MRHIRRADRPLLDPGVLRLRSLRTANVAAGTPARVAVDATPHLPPLLFQVGLGRSPLRSGRLVLVSFADDLLGTSATTWTLRRRGVRRARVVNGVPVGLSMAALALGAGGPAAPLPWALLLAGLSRSLQVTGPSTLAFAEVEEAARGLLRHARLPAAQQVAMALGVVGGSALVRGPGRCTARPGRPCGTCGRRWPLSRDSCSCACRPARGGAGAPS